MPNRVIRDSVLDSDRYVGLTHDAERLLFMELLLMADDFGLVPLNFAFLRRRASPCAGRSEKQVNEMVEQLVERDLVRLYRSDSASLFGYIPRFGNVPRAKKPKWPLPPEQPAFIEINNLARSCAANVRTCKANAQHLQTNAPETETETETETAIPSLPTVEKDVKGKPSTLVDCPHAEILKLFAQHLPMARQPADWTTARQTALRSRWREKRNRQNLDWWAKFFAYVAESAFLTGRAETSGRKRFLLSLDWLLKEANFLKTIEGAYHEVAA